MKKRKSCRSHGERVIKEILTWNKINFHTEYTYEDCLNSNNNKLRFDFYLPDYNTLIEYQGKHHYEPVNKGYRAKVVTKTTQTNDTLKRKYAIDNNIKLVEIPYWDFKKLEIILSEIIIGESFV